MRMNKKGVSLITVLLFMLVATIAATATFKWLTSENSSSSSRMMMNEARQSATAGLDAARSWMTYNANDVGAMLKSFYDGNQKPVKLNSVLNPLTRDGQSYDVFLTAVNTENTSYKMKLVSVGKARNGKAKYSESAILKVNGLYQVKVPVKKVVGTIDYEFDYFGGSTTMGTNTRSSSMLVNGNLNGSQIGISKNLVVTGNLSSNETNHLLLGKNSCVGGNLIVSNQGVEEGGSLYVDGNVTGFTFSDNAAVKKFLGSAYFNGNVTMSTMGAGIEFDSNMTLNGTLTLTSQMKKKFTIHGNTCLGANAKINFASPANQNQGGFLAEGDVWIPKGDALSGTNMNNAQYVFLGNDVGSDVFIKDGEKCSKYYHISQTNASNIFFSSTKQLSLTKEQSTSTYEYTECPANTAFQLANKTTYNYYYGDLQSCGFGRYCYPTEKTGTKGGPYVPFTSIGHFSSNLKASAADDGVVCAEGIKAYCDEYFGEPTTGCDGSHYKIDDILMPAVESFSASKYQSQCVADVVALDRNGLANGEGVKKLNTCYSSVPAANKFGEYLVVKIPANKLSEIFVDPNNYFIGKFIILVDEEETSTSKVNGKVPGTDENSIVFLYLPNGAGKIQKSGNSPKWNYFVYSLHDVEALETPVGGANLEWNGSFYMSAKNCAKIKQVSDRQEFVYNPLVLNDLTANNIVCPYEEGAVCGAAPSTPTSASSSGSGSSGTSGSPEGYDTFFISTSPQLSITLESQYKNEEIDPDDLTGNRVTEIAPSYIVLPRIIYLPQDPVGRLSDYYTVMGLNGAQDQDGSEGVVCPSEISTGNDLYNPDNPVPINEGVYTCVYTKNQLEVPFYVVVKGLLGANPPVSFVTPELETSANASVPVKLKVKKGDREMTVTIMAPSTSHLESGWSYTPQSGTTLVKDDGTTSVYEWKGTPTAETEVTVFNVVTDASAGQGDVVFQLTDPCDGCFISSPFAERVFITGRSTIKRQDLSEYCKKYPGNCTDENNYNEIAKRPNCGSLVSGEWVRASGTNCVVNTTNEEWNCGTNTAISLTGTATSQYCDLFIPSEDNSITAPEDEATYPLYASLKRRPFTLTVRREGSHSSSEVHVYTSSTAANFGNSPTHVCNNDLCEYTVYAGDYVQLKYKLKGTDKFSYWRSTSENSPTTEPRQLEQFTLQQISANNTVLAKFNDRDKHCFYEDFVGLKVFCDDDPKCITDCSNSGKGQSCPINYENSVSNWQLAYKNTSDANGNLVIENGYLKDDVMASKNTQNCNNKSGCQTIIMSTKLTGKNGIMSAMLQTTIFKSNGQNNEGMNSGFIFRSGNETGDYLIMNILGYGSGNKAESGTLYARLCVGSGQGLANSTGICQQKPFSSSSLTITQTSMIKLNMVIEGGKLQATAEVGGSLGSLSFDLTGDYDIQGEYLGMAVTDSWFKLYDFGWESTSFPDEGCFDVPTLNCSFKANYLGGIVPKDSLVTPWAAASSWFTNNDCRFTYYYNGDDNQTNMMNDATYGHRLYGEFHWPFWENEVKYKFSEDGLHGPTDKDAVVVVRCPAVSTSLDGKSTSCGNFQVGSVEACSKNYDILTSTEYYSSTDLEIQTSSMGDGINLRESDLWFNINGLAENQSVEVQLKDAAGLLSQPEHIYANGAQSVNINIMSNVEGFDPQKIVSIILRGTSSFSVTSIQSSCPYVLSVSDCSVWYDGTSWQISSTISNANGAAENGCSVTSDVSGVELSEAACPTDGRFVLTDADFYTELNTHSTEQTYKFTIHVKDRNDEEVAPCETEVTYKPVDITCNANDVVKGAGTTPDVKFSISNCPASGCPYTVTFDGGSEHRKAGTYKGSAEASWNAKVSTSTMDENSEHTYTIDAMGKTKDCKFTVKPQVEATGSCSLNGSVVSIDVHGSNYQNVPVTLGLSDGIGNVLGFNTLNINQNKTENVDLANKNLTPGEEYTVTLTLNGNGITCGKYTAPEAQPDVHVTCPGAVSNQDPTSAISVTPTVTGCDGGCDWTISPATTDGSGSSYTGGGINFYNTNGSGTVSHTLTVSKGAKSDNCSFNVTYAGSSSSGGACIAYVGGASNHANNCFNTGLQNMNGKCYKCNPERGSECSSNWLNDNASESYWWVETPCNGSGSGSGTASSSSAKSSSSAVSTSSSAGGGGAGTEIQIAPNTTLTKGHSYTITGCSNGGSRIQLNNAKFKNCMNVLGSGGTYWYNNDNDCGGEIMVTYPITVTIPSSADLIISNCGN